MPEEVENEEVQEEFGWENLSAHDDGSRDMGDILPPDDEKPEPPEQPAAEPAEQPVETPPETDEPTAPEAAEQPDAGADEAKAQAEEQKPEDEVVYTLPGGEKVKRSDLIADDKLLQKLVTHSNQLTHFQKLSEEREAARLAAEAEKRQILDQYTQQQMQQQYAQEQQQPVPQRPPAKAIEAHFEPALNAMVESGRLTEDHKAEFGGLIAEHMYDMDQMKTLIAAVVDAGSNEISAIQSRLVGEVVPSVQDFRAQSLQATERQIQQEAASIPGYEALAEPEEWQRLVAYVGDKITAHGVGPDGQPVFSPNLDAQTAAQMYDAMTGATLRQQLLAQQALKDQQAKDAATASQVGGEGAARAGTPPQVKQPSTMTPQEEAMDFTDPQMTTG